MREIQGNLPARNEYFGAHEPDINNLAFRYEQEQKKEEQIRQNIERIKTPIEKI